MKNLIVFIFLLSLIGISTSALSQTGITTCQVISSSGDFIVLNSIVNSTGICLDVNSDDVLIDLSGNNITGLRAIDIGVNDNITIINGTLTGNTVFGIFGASNDNVTVEDVNIFSNNVASHISLINNQDLVLRNVQTFGSSFDSSIFTSGVGDHIYQDVFIQESDSCIPWDMSSSGQLIRTGFNITIITQDGDTVDSIDPIANAGCGILIGNAVQITRINAPMISIFDFGSNNSLQDVNTHLALETPVTGTNNLICGIVRSLVAFGGSSGNISIPGGYEINGVNCPQPTECRLVQLPPATGSIGTLITRILLQITNIVFCSPGILAFVIIFIIFVFLIGMIRGRIS